MPIVNRLLPNRSEALVLSQICHYEMQPRYGKGGFTRMAWRLLYKAGYDTPDQAWESMRYKLPGRATLAVDSIRDQPPDIAHEYEYESLIAALILGKCDGYLFSPDFPIVWSELRLTRCIRLIDCSPDDFGPR